MTEPSTAEAGAAEQPDLVTKRRQRNKRLKKNVGVGAVGLGLSAVAGLITVPLLLHVLGPEAFGVYATITAMAAWLRVGTLGIGNGLLNALVACIAAEDEERARKVVSSLFLGLAGLLGATLVVFFAIYPFVGWSRVVPSDAVSPSALRIAIAVVAGTTLLSLAMSPVTAVFSAHQEEFKVSLWSLARTSLHLLAVGVAFVLGLQLVGVVIATSSAAVLTAGTAAWWLFWRDKPNLRPRLSNYSGEHLRPVLKASLEFFAIDVAALLVFQADKFIIIHTASASDVAEFEIASRLFLFGYSTLRLVLTPLWPALGESINRGDIRWARHTVNKLAGYSIGLLAMGTVVAGLWGPWIAEVWTRQSAQLPDSTLFLLLGAYFCIRAWTDIHSILLYSIGKQVAMLHSSLAHGVLAVTLGYLLGRAYGVHGVVVANILGFVLTAAWYVPWTSRRHLARREGVSP